MGVTPNIAWVLSGIEVRNCTCTQTHVAQRAAFELHSVMVEEGLRPEDVRYVFLTSHDQAASPAVRGAIFAGLGLEGRAFELLYSPMEKVKSLRSLSADHADAEAVVLVAPDGIDLQGFHLVEAVCDIAPLNIHQRLY